MARGKENALSTEKEGMDESAILGGNYDRYHGTSER